MGFHRVRRVHVAFALLLASSVAHAGELTKEQCVDAHSRGQDAREQGKLALARKIFLACAQSSCPNAVQSDCARFADDLTAQQPTIVLAARDADGHDLANTSVTIDGALVASTLDGRPIEIDPGTHTVRFSHRGKDHVLTVVIGAGEKGRTVAARFDAARPPTPSSRSTAAPTPPIAEPPPAVATRRPAARTTHPSGAMATAIAGGVVALSGGAVAFYGASQIPSSCSLSTNQCVAPPGDPVFDKATRGARTMNVGIITSAVGLGVFAGGLVWYIAGAKTERESATQVSPVVSHDSAGFAVSGRF